VLVAAGIAGNLRDGLLRATESIDSGAARRLIDELARFGRAAGGDGKAA